MYGPGDRTFTNDEVGFSIEVPPNWSQQTLPDQNDGAIHGMGFGGACPTEMVTVQVAGEELPSCYATNADGTEAWNLIGYEVSGGNSFSVRAYTNDARLSSHDLVLQVLSTLTFVLPAQPQAGVTIQPLPVEVCNGQAQAMAHFLDVLAVTQSEEPLSDPVTGATGGVGDECIN